MLRKTYINHDVYTHDYLYYYQNGIVDRTITRLFDRCAYGYCARARLSVNRDRKMC